MLALIATLAVSSGRAQADGGTIKGVVDVQRPKGTPAGVVLVYVIGFKEEPKKQSVLVKQVERKFIPDLVAVTVGGTVGFPNGDPFLHNVFSPTTARSFDLGSYPRGEARSRTFPKLGVIDIYCNIHPEMTATVVVLPNTRFVTADAAGRFEIRDVPPGDWSVFAYSRRVEKPVSVPVSVTNGGTTEIKLKLDEVQKEFRHRNKFGEQYRETTIYAPGA